MKKAIIAVAAVAVLGAAAYGILGMRPSVTALGQPVPAEVEVVTVKSAAELAEKQADPVVVLKGTVEEKCPTSGCWFYLRDDTGRIRVDTQFSGFTIVDQKTGSEVTVYGKVIKPKDGEAEVSALGAEFK